METKKIKVLYGRNGKGHTSTSVSLSLIWLKKMGVTEEDREVRMTFDGKRIIIEKADNEQA